jgi:hypothetical protein
MVQAVGAEDRFRFRLAIGLPNLVDAEGGEHDAFRVAEREHRSTPEPDRERFGHVQRDGNGPERPVREPHLRHDSVEIRFAHETCEGGEPPIQEELQIAELAGRQIPRGPVARSRFQFGLPFGRDDEIGEGSSVRIDDMSRGV